MEKIKDMMIVIGILFMPFVLLYILFCICWYGAMLLDGLFDNLFGLTDLLGMLMFDTYSSNSEDYEDFTYYTFNFNQDSGKADDYEDFEFEDSNQDNSKSSNTKDYYKILGVSQNASQEEIKRAWRRLCKKHHPDYNQGSKESQEKMKQINEAYEMLIKSKIPTATLSGI